MDFFRNKRYYSTPFLLKTLQNAYEDAYQSSVGAILLETQDKPGEALVAWKDTLKKISTHMATVTETPKTSQEIDLMTNIMNIEKQCHNRISFLQQRWPDTNPYAPYNLIDIDDYEYTNSRDNHSNSYSSQATSSNRYSNSDDSSPTSSGSYTSNSQPTTASNPSFVNISSPQQPTFSNFNSSNVQQSMSDYNPFSSTAPVNQSILSSARSNYASPTSNYNQTEYFPTDYSSYSSSYTDSYYDSQNYPSNPPPKPPKIALDSAQKPPNPPPHLYDYKTLDPKSTNSTASSSTTTLNPLNKPPRASPKRRPTPSKDTIASDMAKLYGNMDPPPVPKQATSTPTLSQNTNSISRSSTPPISSGGHTKADSMTSLSSRGSGKGSLKSPTPPIPVSVEEQYAALSLRRSPSPKQQSQQTPPASRTMLKTLRGNQKVPKKLIDERKAASANAAANAWPTKQDRVTNQQISLMAASISSNNHDRSNSSTSMTSSSSSSAKRLYNKPVIFRAPIIHAPIKKSSGVHSRPGSAPPTKSEPAKPQTAAPKKGPKYIIERKTQPVVRPNLATSKSKAYSTTSIPTKKSSSTASPVSNGTPRSATPKNNGSASKSDNDEEEDEDDDDDDEETKWFKHARKIVKKIKGIDQNAADQIFNDVVVKGDPVVWSDIAGLEQAKSSLKEAVVYPFLRPDLFSGLREPAQGMLLFGPPGTGKTMLARAVATESKSTFFSISASSLTSKFLGESEKLVRALFLMAKALAPSIIFVDEIDSLLAARSDNGEHETSRRIKTEFLIQWSALQHAAAGKEHDDVSRVLVLGATNLPWVIDEAARRRFVRRQYIPLPEAETRKHHIEKLLSRQKHSLTEEQIQKLIDLTDGFSGSDMTALAKDAAMGPLRALGDALLTTPQDQIRPLGFEDFIASLKTIRPSVSQESLKVFEDWAAMYGSSGA